MIPKFANHPGINEVPAADIGQGQLDMFSSEFLGGDTYLDPADL